MDVLAEEDVRTQIDMPPFHAVLDQRGNRGERQRGLRNVISRIRLDFHRELFTLLRGRVRADEHTVAARFIGSLDDKLVEILEHVFPIFLLPAKERGHVR